MAKKNILASIGLAAALSVGGCASTMESLGVDNVKSQGCLLGTGAGALTGAVIGSQVSKNRTQGAIIGGVVGGAVGYFAGCNYGELIEKRRAEFEDEASFHENQIALADAQTKQLAQDNANIEQEIATTNTVIARLEGESLEEEQRKELAKKTLKTNKAALKEYQKASTTVEQEIELQETLIAQIKADDSDSQTAADMETKIASLKAENAKMVEQIEIMTAQSEQIGGYL